MPPLPKWGVAGRELASYARQALLLPRDVTRPVVPHDVAPGEDVVVCMHGLFATAGVLQPLRKRLEKHGLHTASMSYAPGLPIDKCARRLAEFCAQLPSHAQLHLLGHSLGGIICRFFAQELGDPRIVQTISIATPFGGVKHAGRSLTQLGRDIDPNSRLLRGLMLGSRRAISIPHLSVIASDDRVAGSRRHALIGGEVAIIRQCGHNTTLFDGNVGTIVERRVLQFQRPQRSVAPTPAGSRDTAWPAKTTPADARLVAGGSTWLYGHASRKPNVSASLVPVRAPRCLRLHLRGRRSQRATHRVGLHRWRRVGLARR